MRPATQTAQCMWVELLMKKDERAHIAPDDAIFNAPLGDSPNILRFLMSIFLSTAPDCIA